MSGNFQKFEEFHNGTKVSVLASAWPSQPWSGVPRDQSPHFGRGNRSVGLRRAGAVCDDMGGLLRAISLQPAIGTPVIGADLLLVSGDLHPSVCGMETIEPRPGVVARN